MTKTTTPTTVPNLADFVAASAPPPSGRPAADRCRVCRIVPAEMRHQLKVLEKDVTRSKAVRWLAAQGIEISTTILTNHLNNATFQHDHGTDAG